MEHSLDQVFRQFYTQCNTGYLKCDTRLSEAQPEQSEGRPYRGGPEGSPTPTSAVPTVEIR